MNAIIIVKLHDDIDLEKAKADVLIRAGGKRIYRSHMKIKAMPEKKTDYRYTIAFGWNACIDEITGDTEQEEPKKYTDEDWWRDYELYEMQND